MRGLSGKQAVVTGAASGIGRAVVERLVEEGVTVTAVDIRPFDDVDEAGERIRFAQADVSDAEGVQGLFDEVRSVWGGLDILCNCAGILRAGVPLTSSSIDDFDRVMDVNVRGPYLCMKFGIPLLQGRGGGSVINVASIAALVAQPGAVSYTTSKGAVLMLTKVAALEHAAEGIRVNAICPGTIDTRLVREGITADELTRLEELHPVKRLGRPDEIAAVAAFLASDECTFATGAPFVIDGGRTIT